jgi:hypothetical protein
MQGIDHAESGRGSKTFFLLRPDGWRAMSASSRACAASDNTYIRTGENIKAISHRPTKKDSFLSGCLTGNARPYWASAMSIRSAYAHHFK